MPSRIKFEKGVGAEGLMPPPLAWTVNKIGQTVRPAGYRISFGRPNMAAVKCTAAVSQKKIKSSFQVVRQGNVCK